MVIGYAHPRDQPPYLRRKAYYPDKGRLRKTISTDTRQAVINSIIGMDISLSNVARIHGLSRNTINTIIKQYKKYNITESRPRGGAHNCRYNVERIKQAITVYLRQEQEEDEKEEGKGDGGVEMKNSPYLSDRDIANRLRREFPDDSKMHPSHQYVGRLAFEMRYRYHVAVRIPRQRNNERNKDLRAEWVRWAVSNIHLNSVIYIDECAFELHMHPRMGRTLMGEKLIEYVNGARYHEGRVTAVMAVSPILGVVASRTIIGSFNNIGFNDFLRHVCTRLTNSNHPFTFIYDNAPIHKPDDNKHVKLLSEYGHTVKRLPPYSPFLNPIEEVFSLWKHGVQRRQAHEAATLQTAMDQAMDDITTDKIINYHNHAQSFWNPCIDKQDII